MFTASHNPAAYNGIKLCLAGARPIGEDTGLAEIERLTDRVPGRAAAAADEHRARSTTATCSTSTPTTSARSSTSRRCARCEVVADTANGMGGLVVPAASSRRLPFELEILFGELDGTFPNHPADPIQPENLVDLKAAVLEHGADIGLAFDGDADRVFLVDERAEPVSGSLTTALVAASHAREAPRRHRPLQPDLLARWCPRSSRSTAGSAVRTRVGHSFIKQTMAETGAVFGGEHSGHYYFRDNYRADSGIIAALVVLELMSRERPARSRSCSRPSGATPTRARSTPRWPTRPGAVEAVAESEAGAGAPVDRLDGLTVDLGDWWYNLRPSNTEPLLRLNVEAADGGRVRPARATRCWRWWPSSPAERTRSRRGRRCRWTRC